MSATLELLDRYTKTCSIASDKDLAMRLRVSKQAVSGWRHGKAHPNAKAVEDMCKAIGAPVRDWLPLIEAERARTPEDKRVWLRLAQAAAALVLAAGLIPASGHASDMGFCRVNGHSVYYVNFRKHVAALFATLGTIIACVHSVFARSKAFAV